MPDDKDAEELAAIVRALLKENPALKENPDQFVGQVFAFWREWRAVKGPLSKGAKRGIQGGMLAAEPRKSLAYTDDAQLQQFLVVANAAGHTLNSVAKAVRRQFGKGSRVNIGKALKGEKSIRASWASYIASLTVSEAFPKGFEATPAHWPRGWAAED